MIDPRHKTLCMHPAQVVVDDLFESSVCLFVARSRQISLS